MIPHYMTLQRSIDLVVSTFHRYAALVHTERWQGVDISAKPDMATWELLDYSVRAQLEGQEDLEHYRSVIRPSIPWADDHFDERVSGKPLNPGEQWKKWPWAQSAKNFLDDSIFSHTYMERYWPRYANKPLIAPIPEQEEHQGIRHRYGDLLDLVQLLYNEPYTRQAYFPVWFPEDTGAHNATRKPCTLGYWFVIRDGKLNVTYYIRSCDLMRHFRDDIYLTIRLMLWLLDQCRLKALVNGSLVVNEFWQPLKPGAFTMHIGSLHCFRNDWIALYGERR